ncbi:Phospholipase D/Transphosphatidylase [Penicillium digitatum]|uniref:T6SS Phospholipase effector Tle1-like catalytic domain-containing protein n=3 Tax=Penicillium digitatum TaxID=36651 RepID=K9FJ16_PEND2|nr:hypothetical protein PDIP_79110 [Penicillium digitatum Pd1]EKV06469.1 hypothetical protein PDIP_79110 [Penicillium digitatum Pd1]EKV08217.1 hypothetical protein PDIG_69820 [Penicillium digitatum PHI26]QQK40694.1 Phospholipase D/Transphosphatidylase [Penicillium digitatum]
MSLCTEIHEPQYRSQQRRDYKTQPVRKRIIICCDGTWQSAVSGKKNVPSNVTRLCRALNSVGTDEDGNQWQQIVWYDSGIGTTSGPLGQKIEGAIGLGLEGNVIEAYNFCVLNYRPGDQIMCFGFSRGAYTARAIAGLISDVGICSKQDLNRFPDLWAVYKKHPPGERFYCSDLWFEWMDGKADENQGARGETFIFEQRPEGDWAQEGSRDVEVVGVFDTVGAIGLPEVLGIRLPSWLLWWAGKDGWENVGLSPNVKHAFQALALDEHRNAFSPTLWYLHKLGNVTSGQIKDQKKMVDQEAQKWEDLLQDAIHLKGSGRASDRDVNNAARSLNQTARALNQEARKLLKLEDDHKHQHHPRTLTQVWFPGYHIHVGGGSSDTLKSEGDMEEMSNITFSWMLDQIKPYLSLNEKYISEEREDRDYHISTLVETTVHKESWRGWVQQKAAAIASAFKLKYPPLPSVQSVDKRRSYGWGTGPLEDSFTPFYYANGSRKRTPGRYDPLDKDGHRLGETFEFIHPVVGFREKHVKAYTPIGRDVKFARRRALDEQGRPGYVYDLGDSRKPLPEWRLGGLNSFERLAISGKAANDYVDELDRYLQTGITTQCRSIGGIRDIDHGIEMPENGDLRQGDFTSERSHHQSLQFGIQSPQWKSKDVSYSQETVTPIR